MCLWSMRIRPIAIEPFYGIQLVLYSLPSTFCLRSDPSSFLWVSKRLPAHWNVFYILKLYTFSINMFMRNVCILQPTNQFLCYFIGIALPIWQASPPHRNPCPVGGESAHCPSQPVSGSQVLLQLHWKAQSWVVPKRQVAGKRLLLNSTHVITSALY